MKILFVLPGLHRYNRGAEVAFIAVASELARTGDEVTLMGAGAPRPSSPYRFLQVSCIDRQHFENIPSVPVLRSECVYEELTFLPGLMKTFRPSDYDLTVTCGYPFINWALRRFTFSHRRPPHVFVTQNGDWPAFAKNSEYRFFSCEGLVCINPDYYERNKFRWNSRLIPNGIDIDRFQPGPADRRLFDFPSDRTIVLMVSALIDSKRVEAGIEAVSKLTNAHLVVAGDGPLREVITATAGRVLPDRFTRLSITPEQMPQLYHAADVFLHMSKEESFGNVFLEALASGLPIVGHDTPRLRWIVGDEAILCDTTNIDEVADRIVKAQQISRARQNERISRAAIFAWPKVAGMYRDFFQEVISDYKR